MKKRWLLFLGFTVFMEAIVATTSSRVDKSTAGFAEEPKATPALIFSTFIGGYRQDTIRDVATDREGNIYITGGTESPDFPTTPEPMIERSTAGTMSLWGN